MTAILESDTTADYAATSSQTMFSVRTLPWAKIGTVIDNPTVDAATAASLGGLDFDVELRPVTYKSVTTEGKPTYKTIPNRKAVVRSDNEQFFSVVSTDYKPVQYRDAFTFMDGINPNYVAAGTLSDGKQGFVVVQLPGEETLNVELGDDVDPHGLFVILRTSHDLSKAVEVAVMPLRNKCMNMLGLPSLVAGAQQRWSFKHVGDPLAKLKLAQSTLARTSAYVDVYRNTVRQLHSVTLDDDSVKVVLKRVLPDRPKRDDQIAAIVAAYHDSPLVGYHNTGWGLTNAVSEYFQWGRNAGTRTEQSMFTSGLSGDTRKYVSRTAQLLLAR